MSDDLLTFCKAVWLINHDDEDREVICSLRDTCYRYKGRYIVSHPHFFGRPPISISKNMSECGYYVPGPLEAKPS